MKRPIIFFIAIALEGIVAVLALFLWKKVPIQHKLLIIYLIAIFITGIIELWSGLHQMNNLWMSNSFTLFEFLVLLTLFYRWKYSINERRGLLITIGLFTMFWITAKCTFEPITIDDTYSAAIAKIIITSIGIWIFFDVLKDHQVPLKFDSRFWIVSAAMIYAVGSLILFTLFNAMVNTSPELIKALWPINWILMIVTTMLYGRGIWCQATTGDKQN